MHHSLLRPLSLFPRLLGPAAQVRRRSFCSLGEGPTAHHPHRTKLALVGKFSAAPDLPSPTLVGDRGIVKYAGELRDFFCKQLWKPSIKPASLHYRPFGAFNWTLPRPPRWDRPLGNDLCIIDLDNRSFDQPGQVFGPSLMSWKDPLGVHGLSLGILNHWLYGTPPALQGLGAHATANVCSESQDPRLQVLLRGHRGLP